MFKPGDRVERLPEHVFPSGLNVGVVQNVGEDYGSVRYYEVKIAKNRVVTWNESRIKLARPERMKWK